MKYLNKNQAKQFQALEIWELKKYIKDCKTKTRELDKKIYELRNERLNTIRLEFDLKSIIALKTEQKLKPEENK